MNRGKNGDESKEQTIQRIKALFLKVRIYTANLFSIICNECRSVIDGENKAGL